MTATAFVLLLLGPLATAEQVEPSAHGLHDMRFGGAGNQHHLQQMKKLWTAGGAAKITNGADGLPIALLNGASRRSVGSLWSTRAQDITEMSMVFELEARGGSGGGAKPASSFALFLTRNTGWIQGNGAIAGTHDSFAGVAVVLRGHGKDTRQGSGQRDIEIFVNDAAGRLKLDALVSPGHGCPAPLLGTQRDGSGVARVRIKLLLYQATLFVLHFNEAAAQWEDCDTVALDQYSKGSGLQSMHVGFSSASGPNSSEQFVLKYIRALNKWDQDPPTPIDASAGEAPRTNLSPHTKANPSSESVEERMKRMQLREYAVERRLQELQQRVVMKMLRRLERIEQEHARDAAQQALSRIGSLVDELKLSSAAALEERIQQLETGLKNTVSGAIAKRLSAIEAQLSGRVQEFGAKIVADTRVSTLSRIEALELQLPQTIEAHVIPRLEAELKRSEEETTEHVRAFAVNAQQKQSDVVIQHGGAIENLVNQKSGGWKYAFLAIICSFLFVLYAFWKWTEKEKKLHCI